MSSISNNPVNSSISDLGSQYERRVAIEIGSGTVKMQVADVDIQNNIILKTIYQGKKQLSLSKLKPEGQPFNEETVVKIIDTLKTIKDEAELLGIKCDYRGFATAVFRDAPNRDDVTQRIKDTLNIPIQVISPEEEGQLGFETAAIISEVPEADMIVWDSGASSTQLTRKNGDKIEVASLEGFGGVAIANKIKAKLNKEQLHPLTEQQYVESLEWIEKDLGALPTGWDLKKSTIVALGAFSKSARKDKQFSSLERVEQAARARCGKTEHDLDPNKPDAQEFQTGSHILSAAVMERYGIDQVKYIDAEGNTTAWLVKPEIWKI